MWYWAVLGTSPFDLSCWSGAHPTREFAIDVARAEVGSQLSLFEEKASFLIARRVDIVLPPIVALYQKAVADKIAEHYDTDEIPEHWPSTFGDLWKPPQGGRSLNMRRINQEAQRAFWDCVRLQDLEPSHWFLEKPIKCS
jgi:hypothetical protein